MVSKETISEEIEKMKIPGKFEVAYCDGIAKINLSLSGLEPAAKVELENQIKKKVMQMEGMKEVNVVTSQSLPSLSLPSYSPQKPAPPPQARAPQKPGSDKQPIPGVKNIIAVASGKGGVGKSTVAVNLAAALSKKGMKVGLCDSDIYGPSMPLMMGIHERPEAGPNQKIIPLEKSGIKVMSIGFLLEEDTAVIWRGPMVMQMVKQFLRDVDWGELDYLILDLPPGTGDAQLTIVQTVPLSGAVIVTTPNDIALMDARRGLSMFREVSVPVLGIIENMAGFECPHCHKKTDIFDAGGGARTSEEMGVPFLGSIPIDPKIRRGGDTGLPVVLEDMNSVQSREFMKLADVIIGKKKGILSSLLSRI